MRQMLALCLSAILILFSVIPYSSADSLYDSIQEEYPKANYIVGVGEGKKSDSPVKDKRVAEVLARLEIAKQIKVRIREETIDIMCEGEKARLFDDKEECKNEFIMVVEETVDEFLEGSKIVKQGERDGNIYAVAVLPRHRTGADLERNIQDSINETKVSLEKTKQGDKKSLRKAQKEYVKAVAYNKEKEIVEGVTSRSAELLEELEREIAVLKK